LVVKPHTACQSCTEIFIKINVLNFTKRHLVNYKGVHICGMNNCCKSVSINLPYIKLLVSESSFFLCVIPVSFPLKSHWSTVSWKTKLPYFEVYFRWIRKAHRTLARR